MFVENECKIITDVNAVQISTETKRERLIHVSERISVAVNYLLSLSHVEYELLLQGMRDAITNSKISMNYLS